MTVRIDRIPNKLNSKATLVVIPDLLLLSDMRKPRNFSASAICTTAYSPPPSCCGQSPSGGLKSLDVSTVFSVGFIFRHNTKVSVPIWPGGQVLSETQQSMTWGICTRRAGKLERARSRLYRSQILQVNMRLKALAEIYTMHSFAPL